MEMHADSRPSKTRYDRIDPQPVALQGVLKQLGYCPGMARRDKPRSKLEDMIPAEWKAYGAPLKPDLPQEDLPRVVSRVASIGESMQQLQKSDSEPAMHEDASKCKKCKITTLPDIRVLKFQGGERLLVKRWQTGYALMRPRSVVKLHEDRGRPFPFLDQDGVDEGRLGV